MSNLSADRRLYLTADKAHVVEEGDPDAAFLLAAPGRRIRAADAERLGLSADDDGRIVVPERGTEAPGRGVDGLPDDFPARDLLVGAGLTAPAAVDEAPDEDLLAIKGLGPAKLDEIRAALA
ncbi:MAG: hypothetical protein ACODAE_07950 [Gemmatimonadota bacterium]